MRNYPVTVLSATDTASHTGSGTTVAQECTYTYLAAANDIIRFQGNSTNTTDSTIFSVTQVAG